MFNAPSCLLSVFQSNRRHYRPASFATTALLVAAAGLFTPQSALALQYTWGVPTGTANWNSTASWTGAVIPVSSSGTSIPTRLLFNGSATDAYVANNDLSGLTATNVTLNSSSSVANTIQGNPFTIRNTTNVTEGPGTGTAFINQDNTGAFTIANNISFTNSVTFGGAGSGTVTFGGVLSGAAVSGITVNNTGGATFVLAGNNTISGSGSVNFTLTAGTVDVQNANALGGNSKSVVLNGGTLQSSTGTTLATRTGANTYTIGGDITLAGSGNWSLGASAFSLTGNRTITANTVGTTGATIAGVIGGSGFGLTVASGSTGTLTLNGANTFSGGVVVNGGTLATGNVTATLGTGNITLADTAGVVLTLGSAVSFADTAGLVFGTNSLINLNFSGNDTLAYVFNSTTSQSIAAGTYTAAQLNSFFGGSSFADLGALGGTFTVITTVPEPSEYAIVLSGLLVALIATRRRKARMA